MPGPAQWWAGSTWGQAWHGGLGLTRPHGPDTLISCQSVVGAEGLSLAFRHMASSLLGHCSQVSCESLLHEVIVCVGYFTVNHPDNQVRGPESMRGGSEKRQAGRLEAICPVRSVTRLQGGASGIFFPERWLSPGCAGTGGGRGLPLQAVKVSPHPPGCCHPSSQGCGFDHTAVSHPPCSGESILRLALLMGSTRRAPTGRCSHRSSSGRPASRLALCVLVLFI